MNNIEIIDSISKKAVFKSYLSFSEQDLKDQNLSMLNIKAEDYFEIRNSNLQNTGLKIKLTKSAEFTNCNLIGCSFIISKYLKQPNNKDKHLYFHNTKLDETQIEQLNSLYNKNQIFYDLKTIINNNGIFISSTKLFDLIRHYLFNREIAGKWILTSQEIQEYKELIETAVSKDMEGHLKKIYEALKSQLSDYEIMCMFSDKPIEHKVIKDMTIDDKDYEILKRISLRECELQNVTFDVMEDNLFYNYNNSQNYNKVDNIFMPHIKKVSPENMPKRLTNSPFTFRRNLYVELGRICNGKCEFCRNQYFNEKDYCLSNIIKVLTKKMYAFNSIVIGGGEPTLKKDDLEKLLKRIGFNNFFYVFSNGSQSIKFYNHLHNEYGTNFYISRHSYDDEINAKILGINSDKILTASDLEDIYANLTLSCTCIRGGIDSFEKILNYINFAFDTEADNILFCNLQNTASIENANTLNRNLNIDDNIFDEAINFLINQGFTYSYPIVSTGGYILYILQRYSKTISFKKYVTEEKLNELWPYAIKRTYDYSMSPNGIVYSNWSETAEYTKIKTL